MARSHAIWLVLWPDKHPNAAFTVKHECASYLKGDIHESLKRGWVTKMADGKPLYACPTWTVAQFLEEFA